MLIADRSDFRAKEVIRDKDGTLMKLKVKRRITEEDIIIFTVYSIEITVSKYMWQKLIELQEEIEKSLI